MDERSERIQRRFDIPVTVAALLTIPLIVIEESDYGSPWDGIGTALNWGTWLVFLAEVVVMLAVVPDRTRWIRDNPVAVSVTILTPPFLPALSGVRLLRLLRVLRLLPLGGLARRLFSARGVRYAALLAALCAIAGGAAFAALEDRSTGDGFYWALTTMTTVGSDIFPERTASKALTIVLMLVGISFVAVLTGAIAERFLAHEVEDEAEELEAELDAASAAIVGELRAMQTRLGQLEAAVQRRPRS